MDLSTQKDQGEFNSCPIITQLGAGFRAGPSNADYQSVHCRDKVLNPYRVGLNLPARIRPNTIDFSRSMAQLLESLNDLNENLREGFGIVATCSDNWRLTMSIYGLMIKLFNIRVLSQD